MTQPTRTQEIGAFLKAYSHPDLANLYNHDMEVQIIVAKDSGERIEGDFKGRMWHAYTDGIQTWKPIRIPFNAKTEPSYDDSPMTFDLASHAEGIGMTGWDWKSRISRWVAFDFDAITGHSEKHSKKLSSEELIEIQHKVSDIPWVEVRKSTGGKGLHIYVYLDQITTQNHNEHASVARAILSQLSGLCSFDFSQKVDVCGGNMWVWHRKMKGTDGLSLIKKATRTATVPSNWRDYLKVVAGQRQRNLPQFIETQKLDGQTDIDDQFEMLTSQRLRIPLEEEHKRLYIWLMDAYPNAVWWDAEHHMLVTHTMLLKEAHEALALKGPYDTISEGKEKGYDHNCFLYPIAKGGWVVRMYTPGRKEHHFWEQDGQGWTKCFYNRLPDFASACRIYRGVETPQGGYHFMSAESAAKAASLLGVNLELTNHFLGKKCTLKPHKQSGKIIVELERTNDDPPLQDWFAGVKSKLSRVFRIKTSGPAEPEALKLDDQIRHIVGTDGGDLGWAIKADGVWNEEPFQHVKVYLQSLGYSAGQVSNVLGTSIVQCWRIVNEPFESEFLPNRQWNRGAAQIRFVPSQDRDNLQYPSWLRVLRHCGKGLNDAIKNNNWCRLNGIQDGGDYLKIWIACLFKYPKEPLPYLFFYGEQNSGKSIFHESIIELMTRGVQRADVALLNTSGFNGELENQVLCVVEETDLRKNIQANNRIKDWVTSRILPIHRKMKQPYQIQNTTHWVQCANSHLFCPVFPGDTRITMCYVPDLDMGEIIPKSQLIDLLKTEAPDFMAEILGLEIPDSGDRLRIPVVTTEDKLQAQLSNQSPLELFVQERIFDAPGYYLRYSELYDKFVETLEPHLINQYTRKRVTMELPPRILKGRLWVDGNFHVCLGNVSFNQVEEKDFRTKFVLNDGKLEVSKEVLIK